MGYNIYNIKLNADTKNYHGLEWVVDGELGRRVYPGTWAECHVREVYSNGDLIRKPGSKVTFKSCDSCNQLVPSERCIKCDKNMSEWRRK